MRIQSIDLQNFRNYETLSLRFSPGINIFFGDNAQGKTNILESIYLCGTSHSHRGSKDREMIAFQAEESHAKMLLQRREMEHRIDVHLKRNRTKGIACDGIPLRRASELFGMINIVFFSPEDLQLVKNGPAERRKFIDSELCQLDKIYFSNLLNYNKVLNQRNILLKENRMDMLSMLSVWDEQFIRYGKEVIERREKFIKQLNPLVSEIHSRLSGDKERLSICYEPNVSASELERQLFQSKERDFRHKTTMTGPHRDDIIIMIDGIDIRKYGSQGQQRTAALSMKMAEIELVREYVKDTPVLLLDDVLSELDSKRQMQLLNSIKGIQTMITCTGLDDFVNHRFHVDKVFQVVKGTVICEN
ncbi:MAG: DNA replication/repair protein RecF [Lachnospiraceae bacterium]